MNRTFSGYPAWSPATAIPFKVQIKKWLPAFVFLSFFVIFCILINIRPVTAGDVTVLIYHRFGEERYPSTNIDIVRFRQQLSFLQENEYKVIPLSDLVSALTQGQALPERAAVITIDDGYKSVYQKAWPILKSFGYPFTVFLYVKATDNKHWDYMTWEQIRELQAAGVDFQNHAYAHARMADRSTDIDEERYKKQLQADITKSTKIFEKELGERPRFFAVPYGEYNQAVIETARQQGYESFLTQDPGSVSEDTDPFLIPREAILGNEWASMEHFKMVLERTDLPFIEPIPLEMPADSTPRKFGARLLHPERYKPGSLGIYVSELGWKKAVLDNGFLSIDNIKPLQRRINRVAISGREKESNRTAIRFWLLMQ